MVVNAFNRRRQFAFLIGSEGDRAGEGKCNKRYQYRKRLPKLFHE
jgi:hypothetical protein